jgi:hypothetical protein
MSETKKPMSLFDHLSNITDRKTSWENLSEVDRKSFSPFMINRFLSMNSDYIELVNDFQKYAIGQLSAKEVYNFYSEVLPKKKQFNKYIKGKKEEKYNTELVELLSNHFVISKREVLEYLDMTYETSMDTIKEILKKYGKIDKDITKLLKYDKV